MASKYAYFAIHIILRNRELSPLSTCNPYSRVLRNQDRVVVVCWLVGRVSDLARVKVETLFMSKGSIAP